jgi:hypothetical protein
MAYSFNTRIFAKTPLETSAQRQEFVLDLSQTLDQLLRAVPALPPTGGDTVYYNGAGQWSTPAGAPPSSLTDLGSPSGNSTINTAAAFLVAVNLKWTTAANWTLTLNNLLLGATVYLRLLNNSGAARTFTILANTSTPSAYTVTVYVPGANPLSGAITINNGNALNVQGVSYTVGGVPTLQLFGFGSTG